MLIQVEWNLLKDSHLDSFRVRMHLQWYKNEMDNVCIWKMAGSIYRLGRSTKPAITVYARKEMVRSARFQMRRTWVERRQKRMDHLVLHKYFADEHSTHVF